jgi:alpha-galactosidase
MPKKIVIIGAGSLGFSSRLTADILTYPGTRDAHFALVDVDVERLAFAEQIAKRIFKEGGYSGATVSATANRAEALKGADFVITSILVGGYEAIQLEIDIAKKYGIDQCIGDTLTPGGIMRCLRTLPVLQDVAHDVMRICPKAHVLNYTNPMGMLTLGMLQAEPKLKLVGLCHSVQGTSHEWARRLGVEMGEVNYECAGINHQAFFTRYEKNGEDLLPRIRKLAETPEIWHGDTTRMEYVKHFGFPVTESSGHVSEYNWWFRKNATTVAQYCDNSKNPWNGGHGYIKTLYDRPEWREEMRKRASWEKPVKLERSIEYGSQIINAVVSGEKTVIYGSVMNNGLISNLPSDGVVEVASLVDRNGLQPMAYGKLPTHLAALNRAQMAVQELAVAAVTQKDPELVFQAMAFDPLTAMSCTLDQIRAMTRELMSAHKKWNPIMEGRLPAEKPLLFTAKADKVEAHHDQAAENME